MGFLDNWFWSFESKELVGGRQGRITFVSSMNHDVLHLLMYPNKLNVTQINARVSIIVFEFYYSALQTSL